MNDLTKALPITKYTRFCVNWLKKNYLSLIIIIVIVAITVTLFVYHHDITEKVKSLGTTGYLYGYLASFIICLVSSFTIILPVPSFAILLPLAAIFHPIPIALAGSTGGIIGELSGYVAGRSGRNMFAGNKQYQRTENWMKRWGSWMIFVLAFIPLAPFDVAGIICGALRFPVWKFLVAGWIGKSLKFIVILLFSSWLMQFLPGWFV